MKEKTTLVICREMSELPLLSHLQPQLEYRYVVASDDVLVQKAVRLYSWVGEVCWIEQMESFYPVANDVIRIVEIINRWLESVANQRRGMPGYLLHWPCHPEGGMTSQRVQDALLLIRSYLKLFQTYEVDAVYLLSDVANWEDQVLVQTARSRGIEVRRIGVLGYRAWSLTQKLYLCLRAVLKWPFRIFRITVSGLNRQWGKTCVVTGCQKDGVRLNDDSRKLVMFQLCSSADKHVENIVPLMKALQEKGCRPVALTWGATEGAEKIRRAGLNAEEMEAFIPRSTFWEVRNRLLHAWREARLRRREFFRNEELAYESVALAPLLWPSIEFFLVSELRMRFRLDRALKEYFKTRHPVAVKLCGGAVLPEGYITWKNLSEEKRPLIFHYGIGVTFDWPYFTTEERSDLVFVAGDLEEQYLKEKGLPADRIVKTGSLRYGDLLSWRRENDASQSRACLKIPPNFDLHILYDCNAVLRGFLTTREQAQVASTLLAFAKEHSSVALIIKPHPTHQPGMLEDMIEHFALRNVFLLEASMLPYQALNAADLVITKYSTIGLEAMLLRRPVMSVLLDGEERWRTVFLDGVEYVTDLESLTAVLEKLTADSDFRSCWRKARLSQQDAFLRAYFFQQPEGAAVRAAEIIAARLAT